MKASNATSARATAVPRPSAQSSARHPPTRTSAETYALTGPSDPPDPQHNAFRKDLADVALAGRVIASHYAQLVERPVASAAQLRLAPSDDSEVVMALKPGESFAVVEDSVGWAWGYAGEDRRVGYVRSGALSSEPRS